MANAISNTALNSRNDDFDDFLATQSGQGIPEVEGANFVKLMQSNNTEVDQHPNNKKRVKDIQIGDFLFRGATPEIAAEARSSVGSGSGAGRLSSCSAASRVT